MKRFILKTVVLTAPIIILAIGIEYSLRQIPNDYVAKKNYLDKNAQNIHTLIFGSSHSFYGLDPVYFAKNTFNASHISQTLDFDLALLDLYKDNFDNLKIIVLPVSYFTLFDKLENTIEDWRIKNYAIYYGLKTNSLYHKFELLNGQVKANMNRLFNFIVNNRDDYVCTELGWGTIYKSEESKDLQETGKMAAERHTQDDLFSEKNVKIFEDNLKIMNQFYEFCKQRNIKLIIFTTPAYYTYRENLNTVQYQKTVEALNKFANERENCYYLDWFEDSDFVPKDFFDADHMNEIGTEKLSRKLSQHLDLL